MKSARYGIGVACVVLLLAGATWAAGSSLGVITPGLYPLEPITNHSPETYRDAQKYWDSLQKVALDNGNQAQFHDLPDLKMKKPYTGKIVLGDPAQTFGVIIDIVGEEKRLYVDRQGKGSFAGETWAPLLNEWEGLQSYWVCAPEPVTLNVACAGGAGSQPNRTVPIEISIIGMINQPGLFNPEKPYLLVAVRTWFLGRIREDGHDKLAAVVDANNNGRYNDPQDLFFIDANDDAEFTRNEAVARAKGVTIRGGKGKFKVTWGVYPDQLIINQM